LKELKFGIGYTIPYLLSHHEEKEYYKCVRIRGIVVCTRCLGVYLGIITSIIFILTGNLLIKENVVWVVSIFPMFALLDWAMTSFTLNKSNNYFRIVSGFFLGVAYPQGVLLFVSGTYSVILVAMAYGLLALSLLFLHKKPK
jgi:uncharacterized membrane protein